MQPQQATVPSSFRASNSVESGRVHGFAAVTLGLALWGSPALAAEPITMRLWPGDAPEAVGQADKDVPTAIIYLPDSAQEKADRDRTPALVIYPGGGYGTLAIGHEGHDIARWANEQGMAGIIVSYRHRNRGYGHPAPMLDAQRAIRLVRSKADEWKINAGQVGVVGFSAGGHLATTVLTHFDAGKPDAADPIERLSCRPNFGIVSYAVVALGEEYTHGGSQRNLLGEKPAPELVHLLSNEKQVTEETPPCFVWHTAEDPVVDVRNSLAFYSALCEAGVLSELHVFPKGRHGIGLGKDVAGASVWPKLASDWVRRTLQSK